MWASKDRGSHAGAFKAINDGNPSHILVPTKLSWPSSTMKLHWGDLQISGQYWCSQCFGPRLSKQPPWEKLKKGQLDIIIGTHRLLSKDVIFCGFGPLGHWWGTTLWGSTRKLSRNSRKIDVLTPDSYPIPRTLHMSMLGNPRPISHRNATDQPLSCSNLCHGNQSNRDSGCHSSWNRSGGQVYYLYNKVDTIEKKVSELLDLVPEASTLLSMGKCLKLN